MNPEVPGARPHAFSRGRPSDLVFQQIGTMSARAGERQRRDFRAQLVSLACASNEMHYSHSDGFHGRRGRASSFSTIRRCRSH